MTTKGKVKKAPAPRRGFEYPKVHGLTLRDYLASQALYAVLGRDKLLGHPLDSYGIRDIGEITYAYADAMLRARKR